MRYLFLSAAALLLMGGCATKSLKIGGMVCPEGHTEEMIHSDFRDCRAYDDKVAEESSRPKLSPECVECLEARGYQVDGEE